jgi:hypothetical protein
VTIAVGVCALPVCPQQPSMTPTAMLPASHTRLDTTIRSPSIPGLIRRPLYALLCCRVRQSVCMCCPTVNTGLRTTCVLADHNGSLSAPQAGTYTVTPSPASPVSLAREPSPSWLRARRRLAPGGAQVEGNFCLAYGGGTGQLPSVAALVTLRKGERYRAGCCGGCRGKGRLHCLYFSDLVPISQGNHDAAWVTA